MDESPALFARYECKYLVPASRVPAIRRAIQPFTRTDRFAERTAGVYPLTSLYLDSADLRLFDMGLCGWSERFKLRARTYSDLAGEPVFFEIKSRANQIVHKRRNRVARAIALDYLRSRSRPFAREPGAAAFPEFALLARQHAVRPVLAVRYVREAYESSGPDALRITFDTRVEYAWSTRGELVLAPGSWRPLPVEGPADSVVLEIKFTDVYPIWVRDLVARFDLERVSNSKYGLAVMRALGEHPGAAPLAAARMES